jgi:hypothetical protein
MLPAVWQSLAALVCIDVFDEGSECGFRAALRLDGLIA